MLDMNFTQTRKKIYVKFINYNLSTKNDTAFLLHLIEIVKRKSKFH